MHLLDVNGTGTGIVLLSNALSCRAYRTTVQCTVRYPHILMSTKAFLFPK